MDKRLITGIEKSPRIARLIEHLYAKMPEIEADRAEVRRRVAAGEKIIL